MPGARSGRNKGVMPPIMHACTREVTIASSSAPSRLSGVDVLDAKRAGVTTPSRLTPARLRMTQGPDGVLMATFPPSPVYESPPMNPALQSALSAQDVSRSCLELRPQASRASVSSPSRTLYTRRRRSRSP